MFSPPPSEIDLVFGSWRKVADDRQWERKVTDGAKCGAFRRPRGAFGYFGERPCRAFERPCLAFGRLGERSPARLLDAWASDPARLLGVPAEPLDALASVPAGFLGAPAVLLNVFSERPCGALGRPC